VETLGFDQRRVALVATGVVVLVVSVLLGFSLLTRPKTEFQREHARAVMRNPRWLKIEIETSDGRHEYSQNEGIFVVVHFSSAAPHMYKADAADGMSESSASDLLHISNGQLWPRNGMMGTVCCDSRLIGLDDEPFTPRTWAPLKLPPGEYEIYLTSRRVFNWDTRGVLTYAWPGSFEVASDNMLKIRVLPASSDFRRRFPLLVNH
jgi:hypothetical protein